jgi:uroporphyrinogen decarboxylase
MVKVMSDGFFFYPLEGPAEKASQLERSVRALDPGHPWLRLQIEALKRVMEIDPGNNYFYNVFSPLTTLRFTLGQPRLLGLLAESPEKTRAALNEVSRSLSILAEAVVEEAKASGVYLSVQNPDMVRLPYDFYRRHVRPSEENVLEAALAKGGRNILHICGYAGVRNDVGFYRDYRADAFNWAVNVEGTSLSEGRRLFPGKVLIGGFPNTKGSVLHAGTKAEASAFAKRAVEDAGRRSFILGADCTMPNDISFERLEWAREAAAE